MAVAYFLAPVTIAGLMWFAPPSVDAAKPPYVLALIVFGFPLLVLLGIVLVWYAGRRLLGPAAGPYAALVAGSSLMYVVVAHLNTLDMGLTLFLFLALCAFLLAQRDEASVGETSRWMHIAWAAMAGAVLSKGLVGIVIPGATLVLYSLIQRDWRLWRRLHIVTGLLLFFVIGLICWFAAKSNPVGEVENDGRAIV